MSLHSRYVELLLRIVIMLGRDLVLHLLELGLTLVYGRHPMPSRLVIRATFQIGISVSTQSVTVSPPSCRV